VARGGERWREERREGACPPGSASRSRGRAERRRAAPTTAKGPRGSGKGRRQRVGVGVGMGGGRQKTRTSRPSALLANSRPSEGANARASMYRCATTHVRVDGSGWSPRFFTPSIARLLHISSR
jgi:hypothetical protein